MIKWKIGCSGFSYKEWKNAFYPEKLPQREWFNYYSSKFSTLELNVTFYRFPQLKMLQSWYDKSPSDFSFAVKAPKLITHFKQMKDCEKYLNDFYTVCCDGLKEKLGPLLFQFPPKFNYTEERLQLIMENLKPDFINVVEFRHASWWGKKIYTELKNKKIVFCGHSYPGLPDDPIVNGPIAYYRFHGVPRLYYSEYEELFLQQIADSLFGYKNLKQVYCYFNNTAAVGAIDNAIWLEKYATGSRK